MEEFLANISKTQ